MLNFIKLGIRNIFKNRRRSFVTVLAVALGFTAINLFAGYISNVYQGLADQAIHGERLGHLTIMRRGLMTQGKLEPEKYLFSGADLARLRALVAKDPAVQLTTPRLAVSGIISNGRASTIFIGDGMVPADAVALRGSFRPDRGAQLSPGWLSRAAFGAELADILHLRAGDTAVVVAPTIEGMTNALDLEVGATYNTGNAGTNDKFILMPLAFGQRLLDFDGADRLTVLLTDRQETQAAQARLGRALADAGFDIEIKSWLELSSFYKQVKGLFDMIFTFIFAIVVVIVLMSIVNTMSMAVMERTREIGTLRSLGMRRRDIVWLFSIEGVLLVMLGVVAGLLLAVAVGKIVNLSNISYIPPNNSDAVRLRVDLNSVVMLMTFLFLALVGLIAALLPARKGARMAIVDAMGHV